MFSHCIVLVVATFIHTDYDHLLFYSLWLVVGGIGALRMVEIEKQTFPNENFDSFFSQF